MCVRGGDSEVAWWGSGRRVVGMEPQETTERVEQVEQVASNTEGRMKMRRVVMYFFDTARMYRHLCLHSRIPKRASTHHTGCWNPATALVSYIPSKSTLCYAMCVLVTSTPWAAIALIWKTTSILVGRRTVCRAQKQ